MGVQKIFASFVLVPFVISKISFGWGDLGHQTVGQITGLYLKDYANVFVTSVLGPEPLAATAIFPDIVRSDSRFDAFAPFHFVEIPYGLTYETKPKVEKDGHAIINARKILNNKNLSREYKMMFLRYFVHVVGDVHQPLHVGNGSDRGANLCSAYWIDPETKVKKLLNLHTIWDENLLDYVKYIEYPEYLKKKNPANKGPAPKRWFGYKEFAELIIEENKDWLEKEKAKIESTPVLEWYPEAQSLHSLVVYPDEIDEKGNLKPSTPEKRLYCDFIDPKTNKPMYRKIEENRIPVLNFEYAKKASPYLKRQILKAGLRAAYLLNEVTKEEKSSHLETDYFLKDFINQIRSYNDGSKSADVEPSEIYPIQPAPRRRIWRR